MADRRRRQVRLLIDAHNEVLSQIGQSLMKKPTRMSTPEAAQARQVHPSTRTTPSHQSVGLELTH